METLWFAVNAVFPIVLIIILGYYLSRIRFFNDEFLMKLNKYVFFVALPVLLFYNIYQIDTLKDMDLAIVGIALFAGFLLFFLGLLIVRMFVKQQNRKGVVLQCIFRSNFAIIGLPLATALGGVESTAIASVLSAFTIPFFNIMAVISLTIFMSNGQKIDKKRLIINVMKNPLIIGVFIGIMVLGTREVLSIGRQTPVFSIERDIPFLYDAIHKIAVTASPIALLVLGGQFKFKAIKSLFKDISIGVVGRLVFAPVIGFGVLYLVSALFPTFTVKTEYIPGFIALFGSPVAVSSAVMASQMKGDDMLASQLVVWTSVLSVFTIFGMIVWFRSMGLL
ncbi:MAG: AEC family transporter [Acholeplasma sp.]|nr:AEC family transporter [Acholeplasma sp.]